MRHGFLLLALGISACAVGGNPLSYPLALQPVGAMAAAQVAHQGTFEGELLTVDDSSIVMLTGPRQLRRFRLGDVVTFRTKPSSIAWDDPRGKRDLTPAELRRLQLVSRYPYGASTGVLAQIGALTVNAEGTP